MIKPMCNYFHCCVSPRSLSILSYPRILSLNWNSYTGNIYHQVGSPLKLNTFHSRHAISWRRTKKKTFQLNQWNVCLKRPTNSFGPLKLDCEYVLSTLSWWKRKNRTKRKPSTFHGPVRSRLNQNRFTRCSCIFLFSLFPVQQFTSVFLCLLVKFHFSASINWISCTHKSDNNSNL